MPLHLFLLYEKSRKLFYQVLGIGCFIVDRLIWFTISTTPDSAPYFRLDKIRDICLDLSKITSRVQGRYVRPDLPNFRNLHSLDLRGLRGNLKMLGTSIARILFVSMKVSAFIVNAFLDIQFALP